MVVRPIANDAQHKPSTPQSSRITSKLEMPLFIHFFLNILNCGYEKTRKRQQKAFNRKFERKFYRYVSTLHAGMQLIHHNHACLRSKASTLVTSAPATTGFRQNADNRLSAQRAPSIVRLERASTVDACRTG